MIKIAKAEAVEILANLALKMWTDHDPEEMAEEYVAIHIERPYDNPFVTIPGAYHTLFDFMRTNGLEQADNEVIPCFETDGESMDVYIACK